MSARAAVPSAAASTFRPCCVNELTDGTEIDQVLLVREVERRTRRDGGDYLRLQLGDRTGAVACDGVGGPRERRASWPRGRAGARAGPLHACTRASARRSTCAGCRGRRAGSFSLEDLLRRPGARRSSRWRRDLRELIATVQEPHLRGCCGGCSARARGCGLGYRDGAGGQALPPGLPPRAARALPGRGAGGQRDQRDVPGASTATWRSPARCCTTSASSRPTRRTAQHRPHRLGPPARGDRARLLPHPPRDRGDRRLSRRSWRGRWGTSSSPTTARSSTAARWCRARARRRWCT